MKLIILDFDGTLADTRGLIVKTMQQTLEALGLETRTDDQCAAMIGLPLKQAFTDLIPMTDEMGERCVETYRCIFNENNALYVIPTFPHVIETLHQLHEQGYTLTIASSRSNRSLMEFVNDMHLNELIPYVLGAEDVAQAKPHPDPVLQTLKVYGCKPEDALVVGDTWYDIEMGRRAGVRTCGVTYGNGTREELVNAGADFLIDDFGELVSILKKYHSEDRNPLNDIYNESIISYSAAVAKGDGTLYTRAANSLSNIYIPYLLSSTASTVAIMSRADSSSSTCSSMNQLRRLIEAKSRSSFAM